MQTSLEHLPEHKREQLVAMTAVLREGAPVEMVILFGSHARGDWVEDLENGYISDYDLMVIVETEQLAKDVILWAELTKQLRQLSGSNPVSLVAHDIRQINHEIRAGQYFYSDVVKEGILLHDSRRYQLARPRAQSPEERLELGMHNCIYWCESASGFWRGANYYTGRGLRSHAAFLLHQSVERYFGAVLLVYTGYKPKSHNIEELAVATAPFHEALAGTLPRVEPADRHLFDLLRRAYIEARYSKSYHITLEELQILSHRVLELAQAVLVACHTQLVKIGEGLPVGTLPEPPSADEAVDVPALPALDDPKAVEAWRDALQRSAHARGEMHGREIGERIGEERGEARGRELGERVGEERGRE
ncbi:MAG TPA: HEPN domain-containing protein, partial [Polyangiaceae bacterium]